MEARLHSINSLVLLFLLSCGLAMAQTVRSVRGQVVDQEGAAVKGAKVTLNRDAKELRAAITDGEGRFVFNGVAAGSYSLSVKAAGFALYQDEATVGEADAESLKIALNVASLEGEVAVNGERAGLSLDASANRNSIVLS